MTAHGLGFSLLALAVLPACGLGGGGGRGSGAKASAEEAAAESLTNALSFNNAGAKRVSGTFPGDTASAQGKGEMTLSPGGGSGEIVVDATVDGQGVVATLVYMAGANAFWSLPSGGAQRADGQLKNAFTVSPDVCADLCDIVHQVKCYEAAQTASGTITQANLTQVLLNCTGSGDPSRCAATAPPPGGNPGTCDGVCANLKNQCAPEYSDGQCAAECAAAGASSTFLTCCANAIFPSGKCQQEGLGEVGFEDCDDDGVCPDGR